ncbi:MAG: hypothetical protein ACKV22_25230 [Bryobacteraceae bacterium]
MSPATAMRAVLLAAALLVLPPAFPQEHGSGHAAEAEHGSAGAHGNVDGWKWANFAILAGLIGYAARKFGGAFFEGRTQEIRKGIDEAGKMKADADARASAVESRLADLGEEIADLRRTAQREAATESERLRLETQREMEKIRHQAEQEIASSLKSAQAELQQYAAHLSVDLARKKAAGRVGAAEQDSMVRAFSADVRKRPSMKTQ